MLVRLEDADEPPRLLRGAQGPERLLDLRGVMAIPPLADSPEQTRLFFRRLARLRDELSTVYPAMRELSMGMSDDLEDAVAEGATMVRVGTAIFGARGKA